MSSSNCDFREKYILHPGDTITSGNTVFTITDDLVAYGGSSVIYSAVSTQSSIENPIKYIIKEIFPNEDLYERKSGIIQPRDPKNAAELKWFQDHLVEEHNLGGLCYNGTNHAVPIRQIIRPDKVTISGKEYAQNVYDGVFAVLDNVVGKAKSFSQMLEHIKQPKNPEFPLQNGGCPTLHTTACLIEKVLLTLQSVHNQNVLFGDIHMDNIWFGDTRIDLGNIGTAIFMDFGCSRKLVDGKHTAPITDQRIFSSKGYRPPELSPAWLSQHDGRLSIQADLFSVGCLFLRSLFPNEYWDHFSESPRIGPRTLQHDDAKRLRIDDSLRRRVSDILFQAMHPDPQKRYLSADTMREDIHQLVLDTEPPKYILSTNLSTPECFDLVLESRKDDMRHINTASAQNNPVFIWGFPGLGKTELSVAYARTYNPDKSYLVRYKESMRDTIIGLQFTDMDDPDLRNLSKDERAIAEEKIYRKKLGELKKYPSDSLLIIDNFDSKTKTFQEMIQEPAYSDLLGINMHILITTRSQPDEVTQEIQPLKEEYLLKLMKRFIGGKDVSDDLLLQLLDACGYHTLSAELIGKAIGNKLKPVSPEYILQKLRDNQLKQAVLPKSRISKDRVFDIDTIYGHLKTLFDIACLSEIEQAIMCHAALLPTNGIQTCIFLRAECSEENHLAVEQLISKGWLHVSQEQIISVHPLVCDLVNEEIGISYEKCKFFLYWMFDGAVNDQMYRISTASSRAWSDNPDDPFDLRKRLVEQFGYMEYSNPLEEYEDCKRLSHMIAEVFANASVKIPNWSIPYATNAAYCFDMAHDQELCLKYSHQALDDLIQKTKANPDRDWHKHEIFTIDERWAILQLRRTWCPELEERLWDIEYAELYGNELFMDHSQRPIEVQSIYAKLRYLLIRDQ